jgi:hypothetical protein
VKNKQQPQVIRIPKPRNAVFAALRNRLTGGGAHQGASRQPQRNDRDLADRIREIGEW